MSLKDNEKDFIDRFFDYCDTYKESGIRFFAIIICFFLLFVIGLFYAPSAIRLCAQLLPFKIDFIALSPLEILYNYFKVALVSSLLLTLPLILYQFAKLRIEKEKNVEAKTDHLIYALVLLIVTLLSTFLTYKYIFPAEIMFLFGLNFSVAIFASSLSAIVSAFIYTLLLVIMLILLPFMRYLIKNSKFFNYSEMTNFKKPVMLYSAILTAVIALPLELLLLGLVFLTFYGWYKILVHYSMKRD
ncbi:MAG: twin-arginine translocase subunit TatC [bacterium]|nr:twin-arginine translocase subunit TatC [bacterium]